MEATDHLVNYRQDCPQDKLPVLRLLKAKFHDAIWFEAGSKMVADRFEAGRRPSSNLSATSLEPASNQLA